MHRHLVDGIPLPQRVAGHPALDFCNTQAAWWTARPIECLTSPRALVAWAKDADLLPPGGADVPSDLDGDAAARNELALARGLRTAIRACALGEAGEDAWTLVSAAVTRAHAHARLAPGPDGTHARWLPEPSLPPARLAVVAVALAAEELLTSPVIGQVSSCSGVDCGWVFADPRQRRRWCSMAVCGNRSKVRRHAQRLRATERA